MALKLPVGQDPKHQFCCGEDTATVQQMTAPDLARGIRDREMKVQSIQTEGAAQTQNFVRLLSLELAIAAGQSQANRIQTADRTKQASRTGLVFQIGRAHV